MNQKPNSGPNSGKSFFQFIFLEKNNRKLLLIAASACLLEFICFKILYPYPDFFSDSYSYIYAASANLDINIWPIGYSKFLMAFHTITHSDTALVAFQYFFLEISCLYFFFTLHYFYFLGKATRYILFIFLFFNPLFLYITNYVNSDPIFAALSLFWISELLWIINTPRPYQILSQAIILFLAFTVRHNAMFYPFISALAFALSNQNVWRKLAGALLGVAFIIPFILHERNAAYKMYGVKDFSPMSGWQLANNALYMRGHIQVDSMEFRSANARELDRISHNFFSHVGPEFADYLSAFVANFFIKRPDAPIKKYFYNHFNPVTDSAQTVDWGRASVVFGEYGKTLIVDHPVAFGRYFLLLNTRNYFLPPLEKLEVYNEGEDEVKLNAQEWFDYKTAEVTAVSIDAQATILSLFPFFFLFVNALFIGSLIWGFLKRSFRNNKKIAHITLLISGFMAANFVFSVGSSIIVLRYQFFPMIIYLTFSTILIEWLDKREIAEKRTKIPSPEPGNKMEVAKA